METCSHCNSQHESTLVEIPKPLPDGMCALCGTQLTPEQFAALNTGFAPKNGS
jgi:transcription elongation factor Elf1